MSLVIPSHYLIRYKDRVVMYSPQFNPPIAQWIAVADVHCQHFIVDPYECKSDVTEGEAMRFYLRYNYPRRWWRIYLYELWQRWIGKELPILP